MSSQFTWLETPEADFDLELELEVDVPQIKSQDSTAGAEAPSSWKQHEEVTLHKIVIPVYE